MLIFTGEYELSMDDKNRLAIPARVREQLDPAQVAVFYQVLGPHRVLCLYPEVWFQRIALAVAPRRVAPDDKWAFTRVNFALAGRVELDRQGRLLLDAKLLRRVGLSPQVTLIGARDHLEVWNPQDWDRYLAENMARQEERFMQASEEAWEQEQQRRYEEPTGPAAGSLSPRVGKRKPDKDEDDDGGWR